MNCGTVLIVMIAGLDINTTRRCSLAGANPTLCGQETSGTGWEAETRERELLAGGDLRIGVRNLFEMGLEAADRGRFTGLYRLRLYRR